MLLLTTREALVILGLKNASRINRQKVISAYRTQALKHHPNKGGNREKFQNVSNAKNTLLKYIENHTVYSPPPPPVYVNKSVYKNFANRKNYASWNKLKTKLGRPLKNNNINPYNNEQQVLRRIIAYYTALNNKKNEAMLTKKNEDMLNYLYHSAFLEYRRKKNGSLVFPRRSSKQKL
jgi:hypothetical protein